MQAGKRLIYAVVVSLWVAGLGWQPARAQLMTPSGPQWWPSRWGPDDEAGASNWMTPEKVLEAVKLITTGKVYRVGRVYEPGMPARGQRTYRLTIPGMPTGTARGKEQTDPQ